MNKQDTILITGATGVIGRALQDVLNKESYSYVVAIGSRECDLTDVAATERFIQETAPRYVFHLAGHVFGIMGNMLHQADSYLKNLRINTNVIEACHKVGVEKITAMGTGAIYPYPMPSNPLREDTLWMGEPHGSERGYAHAKRSMLAQLDVYRESYGHRYAYVISCNLYGPHDRFNTETGHVVPSLVKKFFDAKASGGRVTVWGDGSAQRDFMYAKDAATALLAIMKGVDGCVNLGSRDVHSIRNVVDILAQHTGMADCLDWDDTKPNGQAYRAYDLSKLYGTGFSCAYSLEQGLKETYDWFAANAAQARV